MHTSCEVIFSDPKVGTFIWVPPEELATKLLKTKDEAPRLHQVSVLFFRNKIRVLLRALALCSVKSTPPGEKLRIVRVLRTAETSLQEVGLDLED